MGFSLTATTERQHDSVRQAARPPKPSLEARGLRRRLPQASTYDTVSPWTIRQPVRRTVVAICKGQKLSEGVAAWLRHAGASANVRRWYRGLDDEVCRAFPASKIPAHNPEGCTVWVTRARPNLYRMPVADPPRYRCARLQSSSLSSSRALSLIPPTAF